MCLWQSLRRVWRLGQTKPVKAVFAVYKNTMEAQALALIGRKMRAAQLLYGDNVGGAIVPSDEGDFITELAREVLRGAELDDLQSLFADEMQVSNSPMGCPTETAQCCCQSNPGPGMSGSTSGTCPAGCHLRGDPANEPMRMRRVNYPFGVR